MEDILNESLQQELDILGEHCSTLYQHLLKWRYNPGKRTSSWTKAVSKSVLNIRKSKHYIRRTNSFDGNATNYFNENLYKLYKKGKEDAIKEGNIIPDTDDSFGQLHSIDKLIDLDYLKYWMCQYIDDMKEKGYVASMIL